MDTVHHLRRGAAGPGLGAFRRGAGFVLAALAAAVWLRAPQTESSTTDSLRTSRMGRSPR